MKSNFWQLAILLAILLLNGQKGYAAASVVYNMRIAMITRRQQMDATGKHPHILINTPFGQWRRARIGTILNDAGDMLSYIYAKPSYYIKVDGALAHISNQAYPVNIARTMLDDLLVTGGYGHGLGSRGRIAYSALFGTPLHRDYFLEYAAFGTGHVGLGAQIDGSYTYVEAEKEAEILFFALRYIYFVPRQANVEVACIKPLYAYAHYDFKLGSLADIFIAQQTRYGLYNRFEFGYNATIGFGTSISPTIPHFPPNLVRHSFFGVYFRTIPWGQRTTSVICGLSGGFDSQPKLLGFRYNFTLWGSWAVLF